MRRRPSTVRAEKGCGFQAHIPISGASIHGLARMIVIHDASEVPRDRKVVIDFFATWCGPCRQIAPYYEDLSKTYPDIEFIKADVDQFSDEKDEFVVQMLPTFVLMHGGRIFGRVEGADINKLMRLVGDLERA